MEIQNIYARARFQAALEQGIEQGIEQGQEKGRLEGIQAMLKRQLRLKFGAEATDAVSARIDEAELETVEGWMEALILSERLDEIFK